MYLVGLAPGSTESAREMELLKRALFSISAHPSFLALPPVALAWASDEPADFRLLDRVAAADHLSGDSAAVHGVDPKTGEVLVVPPPDNVLALGWQGLAAVAPKETSGSRWPHQPRAAIFLGFTGREKVKVVREAMPSSLSPVRNFAVIVYKVEVTSWPDYWSAVTWEVIYRRLLGRAR
ncbi:MAG TPA: hypothetical protein VMW87_07900 [Spirochaetia bacterium]|nr:hypothetical protein [Spirochaetia bacterium]